jgi:hypothetical protein
VEQSGVTSDNYLRTPNHERLCPTTGGLPAAGSRHFETYSVIRPSGHVSDNIFICNDRRSASVLSAASCEMVRAGSTFCTANNRTRECLDGDETNVPIHVLDSSVVRERILAPQGVEVDHRGTIEDRSEVGGCLPNQPNISEHVVIYPIPNVYVGTGPVLAAENRALLAGVKNELASTDEITGNVLIRGQRDRVPRRYNLRSRAELLPPDQYSPDESVEDDSTLPMMLGTPVSHSVRTHRNPNRLRGEVAGNYNKPKGQHKYVWSTSGSDTSLTPETLHTISQQLTELQIGSVNEVLL